MKWLFYVIVFIYMFYRTVYGKSHTSSNFKDTRSISIDPIDNKPNGNNYFEVGKRITIACKSTSKNQKVEWVNPDGEIIQRDITGRVYVQEHFVASHKTRVPALLLVLSRATVRDTGVWECRSGDVIKEVSVCVIEPSSFVDTNTEVTVDEGRSITLSCQARGNPEPRLLWYRNGEIINDDPDSPKYKLMTQYHSQGFAVLLTIMSVESGDSGEYNCEAIQESPYVAECSAKTDINITLYVNYPPKFEGGNETALIPGQDNKSVDLVCAADAFPTPTYRWFKEVGDVLSEYSNDIILLQHNGKEAVLTVTANSSTFGHRFRCRATNRFGNVDKVFSLIELETPRKPDEIILEKANHELLYLYASWGGDIFFPVDDMHVQYLKKDSLRKKSVPREIDWKRSKEVDIKIEADVVNEDTSGVNVVLEDLEEETDYWIRMRAVNEAGTSSWSKPITASTLEKTEKDEEEPPEEVEENGEEDTNQKPSAAALSDSTFYGVFFAGGIVVIVVGCMFIMRMV